LALCWSSCERFVVGRRGEPSVVIMSMKDYMHKFSPAPQELHAMQATAKRTGANKLSPARSTELWRQSGRGKSLYQLSAAPK
jgi:hypothetical protein